MIFFCYISSKRKQNSNGKRAEKMMVTLLILWKCVYGSPIVMSTLAFKEDLFWNPRLYCNYRYCSKKGQDCYKYTPTQNAFWAEPGFWVLNCLLFMKFFIPSFFVLWRKIPDLENSSFVKLIPIFFSVPSRYHEQWGGTRRGWFRLYKPCRLQYQMESLKFI